MLDRIVRGGTVIDGTGAAPCAADVGIRHGRIVEIGDLRESAADEVSAAGSIVMPGFIDVHVHVDALLLADPDYAAGLRQGVTSVVVGNDGLGLAPTTAATMPSVRALWAGILGADGSAAGAYSVRDYLAALDESVAPNVGLLLPHGPLRLEAMGLAARPAAPDELADMARASEVAYRDGALGLAVGLDYVPCRYATADEFATLARVAAAWGGPFVTHMRDYVDDVEASVAEAIAVGSASGAAVHISHFSVRADRALPLVDAARAAGHDVTFDLYPYLAGAPSLAFFLPGWIQDGGMDATLQRLAEPSIRRRLRPDLEAVERRFGWDRIVLADLGSGTAFGWAVGSSVRDVATRTGAEIADIVADLLIASDGAAATVTHHRHRSEADQARLIAHPGHIGSSDGVYVGERPHPRGCGAFVRYVAMALAAGDDTALPTMVAHLTSAAADRFGLRDRGRIAVGAAADIVVIDPERLSDRATYENPRRHPDGVDQVLVNGVPVVRDGQPTGSRPGRVLRRT